MTISHEAQELYLYALNDSALYHQKLAKHNAIQREHVEALLQKRFDKGDYDSEKAARLWLYFADNAAKKYHKQFCGNGKWFHLFNIDTRREMATLCEMEHHDLMKVRED